LPDDDNFIDIVHGSAIKLLPAIGQVQFSSSLKSSQLNGSATIILSWRKNMSLTSLIFYLTTPRVKKASLTPFFIRIIVADPFDSWLAW